MPQAMGMPMDPMQAEEARRQQLLQQLRKQQVQGVPAIQQPPPPPERQSPQTPSPQMINQLRGTPAAPPAAPAAAPGAAMAPGAAPAAPAAAPGAAMAPGAPGAAMAPGAGGMAAMGPAAIAAGALLNEGIAIDDGRRDKDPLQYIGDALSSKNARTDVKELGGKIGGPVEDVTDFTTEIPDKMLDWLRGLF